MARPTLGEIRGLADFATTFRWNMSIVNPGSGLQVPENLNLRCESIDLPKATMDIISVQIRGHEVHQPGIMKYPGTITLNFVETVDSAIVAFFKSWREACWATETGVSGTKEEIRAEVVLELLDNQDKARWVYHLFDCFYQDSEQGGTPDGSTSDALKPTITLQFSYFKDAATESETQQA